MDYTAWRRQSKRWDVIPKKVTKTLTFIPDILQDIFSTRAEMQEAQRKKKRFVGVIHSRGVGPLTRPFLPLSACAYTWIPDY